MGAWIRLRTISVRVRIPPQTLSLILAYSAISMCRITYRILFFPAMHVKKRVQAHILYTQCLFLPRAYCTVDINI